LVKAGLGREIARQERRGGAKGGQGRRVKKKALNQCGAHEKGNK